LTVGHLSYLVEAHLEGANLRRAHLERANLIGAHLAGADLRWTILKGACLWGAHLEGVDLEGANLKGASLRGAYVNNQDWITELAKQEITGIPEIVEKYKVIPVILNGVAEYMIMSKKEETEETKQRGKRFNTALET
jgi:uncharacterized protein YjbI with pentapeptide repeats